MKVKPRTEAAEAAQKCAGRGGLNSCMNTFESAKKDRLLSQWDRNLHGKLHYQQTAPLCTTLTPLSVSRLLHRSTTKLGPFSVRSDFCLPCHTLLPPSAFHEAFFLSVFWHSQLATLLCSQVAPIASVAALIYRGSIRADGQAPIRHVSIYLVSFLLALLFP